MSIYAKCSRCRAEEETTGRAIVSLFGNSRAELPKGWDMVTLPPDLGGNMALRVDLCPLCIGALRGPFMANESIQPGDFVREDEEPTPEERIRLEQPCTFGTHYTTDVTDPDCARCGWSHSEALKVQPGLPLFEHKEEKVQTHVGRAPEPCADGNHVARSGEIRCQWCGWTPGEAAGYKPVVPEGSALLACPEAQRQCGGWYQRGKLTEHMQRDHAGGGGSSDCPFCGNAYLNPRMSQHISDEHPEHYEMWSKQGV